MVLFIVKLNQNTNDCNSDHTHFQAEVGNTEFNVIFELQNGELLNDCSQVSKTWNHYEEHEELYDLAEQKELVCSWAEVCKLFWGRVDEESLLAYKIDIVSILHGQRKLSDELINQQGKEDYDDTEKDREQHLIFLSLLDALLPNVELEWSLFSWVVVSKRNNVLN